MEFPDITALLQAAISARTELFDEEHQTAFRLFNGFYEGCPKLVLDTYAQTLVIHNYANPPEDGHRLVDTACIFIRSNLPWLRTVILKTRHSDSPDERRGQIIEGREADRKILEYAVWYAIDLMMNRDASLYLDTRNLRKWALDNLNGKSVLNTFAYTGSLGVAAMRGGAKRVVHLDLNRKFMNLAKTSYTLNGFPINKKDFVAGDFFPMISRLKRSGELFDCVFLDPPFFATTDKGTIDLMADSRRLINKVRPLVTDGGWLAVVNNALFLSGTDYISMLKELCADGYLQVEKILPVPEDFTGYPETRAGKFVSDPAPFNHPTKIIILKVSRKA